MQKIHALRKTHGGVYVTELSDGSLVPWKPLSLNDWILYTRDYSRAVIPNSHLEDEIFRKCVLDSSLIRQLDFLPAGTITSVVSHIWEHSGPGDAQSLSQDLETARAVRATDEASILHDLADLILTAFPYRPEEVYALDYETFITRVAGAEKKLIALGIIQEPIAIEIQQEQPQTLQQQSKPRPDAKQLWEQQEQQKSIPVKPKPQPAQTKAQDMSRERWWQSSPVLESDKGQQINFQTDAQQADGFSLDSHDLNEPPEMQEYLVKMKTQDSRAKMVSDAQWIYKDLLESLASKKTEKK